MKIHDLRGHITSVGFASGDRFVVGSWQHGPIGPMNDVMWADATGRRTLIAPSTNVSDFVGAVYQFERVVIEPVEFTVSGNLARLRSGSLSIEYRLGRRVPIPFGRLRTLGFTRFVEGPIARLVFGVHTHGVSSTGIHEWYRADSYRRVVDATATLNGVGLGEMCDIEPPLGVGFSEPPRRPSSVAIRPALYDPSGRLDALVTP